MKALLFTSAMLIVSYCSAFAQCPTPGLKIQSAACEEPKNLKATQLNCTDLKIQWTGNKGQGYVFKAAYIDPATNNPVEVKNVQSVSDTKGNFNATIKVKEGASVTWSVQAICTIENATVYSAEVKGTDVTIPFCQKIENITLSKAISIYPNPTFDYLNVAYTGKIEGSIEFRVLDVNGKKIMTKVEGIVTKTSNFYTLDLRTLPPGTYMLEAINGNNKSQAKFVRLRN